MMLYVCCDSYEINASATESGYTIKSHYRAMPKEQESVKVRIHAYRYQQLIIALIYL